MLMLVSGAKIRPYCAGFQEKNFTKTSQKLHKSIFAHFIEVHHFAIWNKIHNFAANKDPKYYETTSFYLSIDDMCNWMQKAIMVICHQQRGSPCHHG